MLNGCDEIKAHHPRRGGIPVDGAQDDMSEEFYNGIAIFPEYATTFAQYASRWIAQFPFHDHIRSPYLE